jgi:hypothetical protein
VSRAVAPEYLYVPVAAVPLLRRGAGQSGLPDARATIVIERRLRALAQACCRRCRDEKCTECGITTMFIAELDHRALPGLICPPACAPASRLVRADRGDGGVVSSMNLSQITIAYGMTRNQPVRRKAPSTRRWPNMTRLDRWSGAAASRIKIIDPEPRDRRDRRVGRILHAAVRWLQDDAPQPGRNAEAGCAPATGRTDGSPVRQPPKTSIC